MTLKTLPKNQKLEKDFHQGQFFGLIFEHLAGSDQDFEKLQCHRRPDVLSLKQLQRHLEPKM